MEAISLGAIMEVVSVVQSAVEICKRVLDLPSQMVRLGKRLKRLTSYLDSLRAFVERRGTSAFDRLRVMARDDLRSIIEDIQEIATKAKDMFLRWENNVLSASLDLQFKFKLATQIWFATVGSTAEKIEEMTRDLEVLRQELLGKLILMGVEGVEMILEGKGNAPTGNGANAGAVAGADAGAGGKGGIVLTGTTGGKAPSSLPPGPATVVTKPTAAGEGLKPPVAAAKQAKIAPANGNTNKDGKKLKPSLSPSPSPSPLRRDYSILFVDPYNVARSVVAEGMAKLLKEWTIRTDNDWRIKSIHSAGFLVKKKSNIVDVVEGLGVKQAEGGVVKKLTLVDGSWGTDSVALDAVFDNNFLDYKFKKTLADSVRRRQSRGLTKDLFKKYDYILVFTGREQDNLLKLRKALVEKEGKGIAPKGKGRILHLGSYLKPGQIPLDIINTGKVEKGKEARREWNEKVGSQIKPAIKGFLKEEMKWKQPDRKAHVRDE